MVITNYKNQKYRIGFSDDKVNLYSLDKNKYQDIINLPRKNLTNAYETRTCVKIRGCEALYNGLIDGFVLLDVRPSMDVEKLGAKQVDRGVYHARLPISEIESMWEERMSFLDFPFPEDLSSREELDIPKW
jgi:hypothetical protein